MEVSVDLWDHLTNQFKWTIRPESAEDIWDYVVVRSEAKRLAKLTGRL
jgi:hypothetical protein